MAGDARRAIHKRLADNRLHTIGTNERNASMRISILVISDDAVCVLLDALETRIGQKLDPPCFLGAF